MLETAIEAARRAGQAVAARFPAARNVTVKGYRDIVTETDFIAERVVVETIRTRYPDHSVVSEEAGTSLTNSDYRWVIDPIDGTTNYARHLPICAVSVALVKGARPILGAIYDPLRDEMFSAQIGAGANLDGKPLRVSGVNALAEALFGFDWGHADQVRTQTVRNVSRVAPLCRTVRGLGSATLALAYVAAGRLDGYLNLALKAWDTAAGLVLVAEAGGRLSAPDGRPYVYTDAGCLATNGQIHDEVLSRLRR